MLKTLARVGADMRRELDRHSNAVALRSRFGQAYGEDAFRYFLTLERRRAIRSGRSFLVLLIQFKPRADAAARLDAATISRMFSCLWSCLRQTDFVGWYREERVAGAVLTQPMAAEAGPTVIRAIAERVQAAIVKCVPAHLSGSVRARVYRVQSVRQR